jgi:hypothetical protein
MIVHGVQKPVRITGVFTLSRSKDVLTTGWRSLVIPNSLDGTPAKWVLVSVGQDDSPSTPCHVYLKPGDSSAPSAGEEDYCPILHGFQGPLALNVAGCTHMHVRAVNVTDVEVHLMAIENVGRGMEPGALPAPPQIAADSNSVDMIDSTSRSVVIPFNAAGNTARRVLVAWDDDTTFIHLHAGSINAGVVLHPIADNPMILDPKNKYGNSLAFYKVGTGADVRLRVTPLEDY